MNWFKNPLFKDKLKVGDWVNSYYKGIHRIEKIYDCYYDESDSTILGDNKIGDKLAKTIVSKRFLNSKFQKSITYDWCNETFVEAYYKLFPNLEFHNSQIPLANLDYLL